ncbi:MAG TPA: hypothetical protein ENI81_06405 [Phycisphaerales bacterium]|nr:hypothetical protein [Phycisphaerales bacterium]
MSTKKLAAIVALMALMTMGTTTWGQRGIGDNDGVTRQAIETQQTSIQGKIKEIVIEKCENTTGPFDIGMHLLLTTDETKQYNVHLGPAVIVRDLIDQLEVGKSVTVKAYRTEKMPKENFVAIVLKYDGKTVRLRDENLRPVWAGGQGRSWGRYQARSELPRWRQSYGRGFGMDYGRGYRAGPGRGMGRGYGRGWSNATGYGRGRGGRGQGRSPGYGYGPGMCPWDWRAAPMCPQYYGWRR